MLSNHNCDCICTAFVELLHDVIITTMNYYNVTLTLKDEAHCHDSIVHLPKFLSRNF